jgi:hypothetical protein
LVPVFDGAFLSSDSKDDLAGAVVTMSLHALVREVSVEDCVRVDHVKLGHEFGDE